MTKKSEEKKERISLYRKSQNFIPYFSNTFFEGADTYLSLGTILIYIALIAIFVGMFEMDDIRYVQRAGISIVLFTCLFIVVNFCKGFLPWYGYQMGHDKITKKAWGRETEITYTEIRTTLQTEKVIISAKGIKVPTGHGKIKFSYEVGDAKQQNHNIDCYKEFCKRIGEDIDMPPMQTSHIDYIDKIYFYQNSCRNCVIALCVLQFFFLAFNVERTTETIAFVCDAVVAFLQYFCIYRIYKAILLGQNNMAYLKGKLQKETNTVIKLRVNGKLKFIIISAIVIVLNLCTLSIAWL